MTGTLPGTGPRLVTSSNKSGICLTINLFENKVVGLCSTANIDIVLYA